MKLWWGVSAKILLVIKIECSCGDFMAIELLSGQEESVGNEVTASSMHARGS